MDLFHKSLRIKEVDTKGMVTAVIATMNIIDKDGDVTLPGFFGKQETSMIQGHVRDGLTLGKGVLDEIGDEAIAQILMNLDIPKARDLHSALKFDLEHGEPLQEWSYAYSVKEGGATYGEFEGRNVRFLGPLKDGSPGGKVPEVSPVLVGAGEGTMTVDVKGSTFLDEAEAALAVVDRLSARVKSLAELRAKQGRRLSAPNIEKLSKITSGLKGLAVGLDGFLVDGNEELRKELRSIQLGRVLRGNMEA